MTVETSLAPLKSVSSVSGHRLARALSSLLSNADSNFFCITFEGKDVNLNCSLLGENNDFYHPYFKVLHPHYPGWAV